MSSASNIPSLFLLNRNYSSWSLRAWLVMRAFKIEFETVMLIVGTPEIPDLNTPAADELMLTAGPTSKVPALHVKRESGEKHIVFETLAIIEYLAEDCPLLWPTERLDRAYARSLAAEMATSFAPIRSYSMNIRQRHAFDPELYNDKAEKDIRRLSSIWDDLRSKAATKEADEGYLFGRFTALDAMYAPVMFRLRSYDLIPKVQGKHAAAYVERILSNEYVMEWEELSKQEKEVIPRDELYY
ncbi:hypothetical protein BGZ80_002813 [Entomortierella chlamydospora]|uniref:GST N-terminal domain-containing protein n=1 Tax=Entomortierella chlamydospora TaxID=101097 RepID=A0A9P6T319_9FUNG|nr:hypothetical protein BGZ80_002813 [Entomortierella chlamydospora]